jgi:hypothetical protein
MGAIIAFPRARRVRRATEPPTLLPGAAVVILPVVRIERASTAGRTEPSKSPSGGKGRRRASRG